jgi:hypothetical protein
VIAIIVAPEDLVDKICACRFNHAVHYTQSSSGALCWMALPHDGVILML